MKNYREIQFGFGNIEEAVKKLKSHKGLVKGTFNGQVLYSDIDDMDSAYKKVTGSTKSEFEEARRLENVEYERQKKEHKEAIPQLTIEWIKKGNKILDEKHHKYWAKIVPIRLRDMYKGFELGACLSIVEKLNNNCELEEAKKLIEEQGHSGMSFGLVCSMVRDFADRGNKFVEYARA